MPSRDQFTTEIYVNNQQAQDALMELNQKLEKLQKSYANLNKNSKNYEQRERELAKQIKSTEASIATAEKGTESYARAMNNLGKRSIEQLYKLQRQLNSEIRKLDPNDAEFAQLSKNYQTVTQRIHALEEAQKGVLASQGGFFKRMTVGLSKYYGALMVGVGTVKKVANSFMESYKTISDFQQANADLSTILGVNVKQMGALTENALALGSSTEYTASQVTQLQTELAKLGFNQGEIIDMSQSVLEFATAVGADLPSAAAMAGVALRSFDLSTKDSEDAMATMAVACSKSALSFEYLQNAFSTIAPVAKTYGLSLKDTIALLGTLANAGFDASSAATATRNILLNLSNTSGKLATRLGGAKTTFEDIMKAFIELRNDGVDLNSTLELTDKRSVAAFNTFLRGAEDSLQLRSELENLNGELQRISEERLNTVEGSIKLMQSAWEGFILSMSNSTGTIKKVIDLLTNGITTIQNIIDPKSAVSSEAQNLITDNLTDTYMRMLDPDEFEEYVSEQLAEYDKRIKKQSKKTKAWGWVSAIFPMATGKWGNSKGQLSLLEGERETFEAAAKSIGENATLSFQQQLQVIDNIYQRKTAQYQSDMSLSKSEADKLIAEAKAEYDASRKSIIKEETERINAQKAEEEKAAEAEKEAKIKAAKEAAEEKKKLSDKEQQQNQKKYNEEARIVDARLNYEQKALKVQLMKQEITQEEYDKKIIEKKSEAIAEKLALAKKYHQDETKLSAEGMDLEIEKIKRDSNAKKKKYDEGIALLKQSQKDEETELKKQLTRNEITQDEYDSKMLESKVNYLKQSVDLAAKYGQDETQIMQAYLDAQVEAEILALQQMEKLKKEAKDVKDSLRTPDEVRGDDMAKELARLEELHDAKLLSEEEYEKAVQNVHKKYKQQQLDEDLENLKGYFEKANKVMEGVSGFVSQLQSAETAKAEAEYQAQLTAAGDNAEKREQIEAQYEAKKLDLQKKYANADMVIQIAQATASAAAACVEAWNEAKGNPYLAATLIGLITASTGAQIATIVAQRNAIMATTANGSNGSSNNAGYRILNEGYSEGGYTGMGGKYEPAGIVHRGEWVAPKWMVNENPVTFANLDQYRRRGSHGRSGSASRGFADGGYTSHGITEGINLTAGNAILERLAEILERLEANGLSATVDYPQLKRFEQKDKAYRKEISR